MDKDFAMIMQEWAILPNNTVPNTLAMEFNWLTFNGKAGPDCTPMIVRRGGRTTGVPLEQSTSHTVGQSEMVHTCSMPPEVKSDKPGKCPKCGITLVVKPAGQKRVPGYSQDMWMTMDAEVAKPETSWLPEGWTGSMMGMMTLVRVLPPDQYDRMMALIKEGKYEPGPKWPNKKDPHQHHG